MVGVVAGGLLPLVFSAVLWVAVVALGLKTVPEAVFMLTLLLQLPGAIPSKLLGLSFDLSRPLYCPQVVAGNAIVGLLMGAVVGLVIQYIQYIQRHVTKG